MISIQHIVKTFGGVHAVDDCNFDVREGNVRFVGEDITHAAPGRIVVRGAFARFLTENATTGRKRGRIAAGRVLPSRIVNPDAPHSAREPTPPASGLPRLVAEGLRCAPARLDHAIDLHLGPGEVLQIEGPNGCGKTSLLRTLCGLAAPEAGRVTWDGVDIGEDPAAFRSSLTFIGHTTGVKRDLSARENLSTAHAIAGGTGTPDIDDALARAGLDGRGDIPLRRLSAGQARRVGMARLLTGNSVLWVLDEPFTALDFEAKRMLERFIVEHCAAGRMALVTTHQPADFGNLPVRILALGSRVPES